MKRYDFNRYVFIATAPVEGLVGKTVKGFTEGFGYEIESWDGKRGVAKELRGTIESDLSLRDLPICLVDYVEIAN